MNDLFLIIGTLPTSLTPNLKKVNISHSLPKKNVLKGIINMESHRNKHFSFINRIYLISKWATFLSINIFFIRITRLVLHSYFIVAWRQAIKAHYANNKNWLCVPSRRKPRLLSATSIIFQFYPVLQRINAQFCVCIGCHATAISVHAEVFSFVSVSSSFSN